MSRLVAKESGRFPFDFDQRPVVMEKDGKPKPVFPDELGPAIFIQALLITPERKRWVKIPPGAPEKPRLGQKRQSRITAALDEGDPKFAFKPTQSDHPDIGVRFDRADASGSLACRGMRERPTLKTARREKTTVSLSGLPPLEPTHLLVDLKAPFETVAVGLIQSPSEFKLKTLTNGGGGMAFSESIKHYQAMLAQRLIAKIELSMKTGPSTESGTLAAKTGVSTEASEDLFPEIPW